MTAIQYVHTMPYIYDEHHAGAHYRIGNKYKNRGEYLESVIKHHMGLDYEVNPATSYDEGSDIECLSASVKSSGASLACLYGESYEEVKAQYFSHVHSTLWIYVTNNGDEIIEYHMNRVEFEQFLDMFHCFAYESNDRTKYKVRIKKENRAMLNWLKVMAEVA